MSATRQVSCEIRALHAEQLTGALDGVLRSVATHAALTEAVLETRVVRLASPTAASVALVEELARQLWDEGFPVSFGPSWVPAPGTDISVGIGGMEDAFDALLQTHPAWRARPSLDKRDASG